MQEEAAIEIEGEIEEEDTEIVQQSVELTQNVPKQDATEISSIDCNNIKQIESIIQNCCGIKLEESIQLSEKLLKKQEESFEYLQKIHSDIETNSIEEFRATVDNLINLLLFLKFQKIPLYLQKLEQMKKKVQYINQNIKKRKASTVKK